MDYQKLKEKLIRDIMELTEEQVEYVLRKLREEILSEADNAEK